MDLSSTRFCRRLIITAVGVGTLIVGTSVTPAAGMSGGAPAPAQPWFGSLVAAGPGPITSRISCGATIISPTRAVTAAHCVVLDAGHTVDPSAFDLHFGDRVLGRGPSVVRHARLITVHAGYRIVTSPAAPNDPGASSAVNDIAVLSLDRRVTTLRPLPLASSPLRAGERATYYGRGITGPGAAQSDVLRRGTVRVITDRDCRRYTPAVVDGPSVVCGVQSLPDAAAACEGDSGGPLVVRRHGRAELAGVFSFAMETAAKPCGAPGMAAFADLGRVPLPG